VCTCLRVSVMQPFARSACSTAVTSQSKRRLSWQPRNLGSRGVKTVTRGASPSFKKEDLLKGEQQGRLQASTHTLAS